LSIFSILFIIFACNPLLSPENNAPMVTLRCDLPAPYPAILNTNLLLSESYDIFSAILFTNDIVSINLCLLLETSLSFNPKYLGP